MTPDTSPWSPSLTVYYVGVALLVLLVAYLVRVNQLLSRTPDQVRKLSGPRWTPRLLRETYEELEKNPVDYTHKLPPRLDRRYVVTGGSGLVGGYIVQQLLARGTAPSSIRILDIRRPERPDMQSGPAAEVDLALTDITSAASVAAAFARPWPPPAARLPLTVFHTAAVILASERSASQYAFPHAVNVRGTSHVLAAARDAGADVFSSTSSGSIAIEPVRPFAFVAPWGRGREAPLPPDNFCQVLDVRDFGRPLRARGEFFGNYPASKAVAERVVCGEDADGFRTGCIRPANGVYGNPSDNTVGDPLGRAVLPTWVPHIVQSFVHGANVAIAHLQHEAVLALPPRESAKYSGRPFVVTDPNPPITYGDLYRAIETLSVHAFRTIYVPPVVVLLLAHAVEFYADLPCRLPFLRRVLPELRGDVRHLKPGIFSICTHLVASDAEARKPVSEGGLGYAGVLTTLQGMTLEILEWNREHADDAKARKAYTTSVSLAEKIQKLGAVGDIMPN